MLHNEWKTPNENTEQLDFKWLTKPFLKCVCMHACVSEQKWAIWDTAGNINRDNAGIVEGYRLELGHALDAVFST